MRRTVLCVLAGLGAASLVRGEERWIELRGPHFTVLGDAGERDARRLLWQFEQIRALFEQVWPWAKLDPSRP